MAAKIGKKQKKQKKHLLYKGSRLPEDEATPSVPSGKLGEGNGTEPFVARGLAAAWPAMRKWDADYLMQQGRGERICAIEIGESFDAPSFKHKLMAFSEFLRLSGLDTEGACPGYAAYLAQHLLFDQFPELLGDLGSPPWPRGASAVDPPRAWIGGAGSRTPPHRDPKDNFLMQVKGEKFCRLYPPSSTMYTHTKPGLTHVSRVPLHALGRYELGEQYPGFPSRGGFTDVILKPGDALYIPRGWYHYVQSISPSISVNFWFMRPAHHP